MKLQHTIQRLTFVLAHTVSQALVRSRTYIQANARTPATDTALTTYPLFTYIRGYLAYFAKLYDVVFGRPIGLGICHGNSVCL